MPEIVSTPDPEPVSRGPLFFLWPCFFLLCMAVALFFMVMIFSTGFLTTEMTLPFMMGIQAATGVILLLLLGACCPEKCRLALWFTAWALAHLLYSAAFYFKHSHLEARIILPAAITLSIVLVIGWTALGKRWARLLFAVPFVAIAVAEVREYWEKPGLVLGFSVYVIALIAATLIAGLIQSVRDDDRIKMMRLAKTNHLPVVLVFTAVGICGMMAFTSSRWMLLFGGLVACAGIYLAWRIWPRRRVMLSLSDEGFICGSFSFPSSCTDIAEASVLLAAELLSVDDCSPEERWERELRACSICFDGALHRLNFAFDAPELTFDPSYWYLTLTLTRQGGKVEKYEFSVEPLRESA